MQNPPPDMKKEKKKGGAPLKRKGGLGYQKVKVTEFFENRTCCFGLQQKRTEHWGKKKPPNGKRKGGKPGCDTTGPP